MKRVDELIKTYIKLALGIGGFWAAVALMGHLLWGLESWMIPTAFGIAFPFSFLMLCLLPANES